MADTDFGILIKAIDQASGTLKSVQGELGRLEAASKKAASGASSLNQAQQQLGGIMSAVQKSISAQVPALGQLATQFDAAAAASVGAGGVIAGVAVAIAAIGAAGIAATKGLADYQERIELASATTGFSVGTIGALKVAASNVGRTFEDLQPALSLFVRSIGQAEEGDKNTVKAFNDLQVAIRDSSGAMRTSDAIFRDAADRLREIEDPIKRNRIAFELFGRGSSQILKVLTQDLGSAEEEAKQLGIILGTTAAENAKKADVAFDRLKVSLQGIMNAFGAISAVTFGPLIENIAKLTNEVAKFVNSPSFQLFMAFATRNTAGIAAAASASVEGAVGNLRQLEGEGRGLSVPFVPPPTDIQKMKAEFQKQIDTFALPPFHPGIRPPLGAIPFATTARDPAGQLREIAGAIDDASPKLDELRLTVAAMVSPFLSAAGAAKTLTTTIGATLIYGFGNAARSLVQGTQNIGQAFNSLVESIIGGIAEKLGNIVGAAIFGALFQAGGTLEPLRAQAGVIVSGVRGVDTVPILAGRGETIVSHTMTDRWDRVLSRLDSLLARPQRSSDTAEATNPIEINVTVPVSGQFIDRSALQDFVQDELVSPLVRALGTGAWRRR